MKNINKIQEYLNNQERLLLDIQSGYKEKDLKVGIFVINLKHRTDKLDLIKKELNNLKIYEYTVIDAIYGNNLSDKDIEKYVDIQTITNTLGRKKLTKPEIGCSASHNEIYKIIVTENYSHAIVFEDDTIIEKNFIKALNQLKEGALNFYFDLLLLGYNGIKIEDTKPSSINKKIAGTTIIEFNDSARKEGRVWGTYGYIISNCGAQKMLAINDKIKFTADGPWNFFVNGLRLYGTFFHFALQHDTNNLKNDITERS
jgi:glycosyl transferase family 25